MPWGELYEFDTHLQSTTLTFHIETLAGIKCIDACYAWFFGMTNRKFMFEHIASLSTDMSYMMEESNLLHYSVNWTNYISFYGTNIFKHAYK